MKLSYKKSGSALLTVLLIMSVLSAVVLYATKGALESSRGLSLLDNARTAEEMAQSGIDEGLLRLQKNATATDGVGLFSGEYGKQASTQNFADYALTPARRGFKPGTSCISFAPLSTAHDPACPYYDLTVRRYVKVTSGKPFTITSSLIGSTGIRLKVQYRPATTFSVKAVSPVRVYIWSDANTHGAPNLLSTGQELSIINSTAVAYLSFEAIADSPPPQATINVQEGSSLVIEKGFTTIDVTGYAGGVQRKLLLTVPQLNHGSITRTEFAGSFTSDGILE